MDQFASRMRSSTLISHQIRSRCTTRASPRLPSRARLHTPGRLVSETPTPAAPASPLNSRWLSDLQARIRRIASVESRSGKHEEARQLLRLTETQWLGFLAGRDGFLTGEGWRGLDRHQVNWGDMVSSARRTAYVWVVSGHVNNVMYNKFAESARVNWILSHGKRDGPEAAKEWAEIMSPRGVGLILKSIKTDFKFPMAYPDQVTVVYKLAERPTYASDHLKLDALLLSEQHRRVAARCIEEVTIYDYRAAKKAVLPPHMVDRLAETYELQEEARREFDERANGVFKAIQEIEAKE
ncbi:hypothetical protein D7B24_008897 [Verticillium nonalfalfae]|uniref:Thioesterase/thiol ester dehydrase-isomerase n=1 Tax=Verticillium nonalfalfae TaxID=1051616 RepID=A0A3M9Y7W9_9PEZI|nr:uncharacterized protein D7B24_008897 [Verticillium nonalfalfae]RNJ55200.1 hypothetical protein D7B24_008897 [Verticillium nonalfalfae]